MRAASRRWLPVATSLVALAVAALQPAVAQDAPEIVTSQCIACHGPGGNSLVPIFPRLASQQAEYTEKQLRDFLAGKRKNDAMAAALAQLKNDDIPLVAAYFAAQPPTANKPENETLVAAGKALYDDGNTGSGVPACVGCHQPGALGNERFPRLAGQHPGYAAAQLRLFRSGERTNDRAKVMRAVAGRLTDDEIAAVVEYLASLP